MKVLITSALPYVNNIPHLGNLIGSTLSADIYARHRRLKKDEVLYVCGADEHGTATENKAREEGLSEQELCDKYFLLHKKIYDWFNISFDVWGRTHTKTHEKLTQEIFLDLEKNGYIVEEEIEQLYDKAADVFLADRFVEGECPYCHYKEARGDQCDNCQRLINATELINPKSKITNTRPVKKRTKHLFLDLPALKKPLSNWLDKVQHNFSLNAQKITQNWLSDLKKRAITRDLKWGVKVPRKGYENKVFYVWFDAPIGYISITAHYREDWQEWWLKDVELVQFMGKDNVVFHSIIFPACLLGTKKNWNLVNTISATEYLNLKGGKFSKSKKIGIFGDDCINIGKEHGISSDEWRYVLSSMRPETGDTEFSIEEFVARVNNELIANWGNLVNRALVFATKCEPTNIIPDEAKLFYEGIKQHYDRILLLMDKIQLREALREIMQLSKQANQFFQHQKPWGLIKTEPAKTSGVLRVIVSVVRDINLLLAPFIPSSSEKVNKMLGLKQTSYDDLGVLLDENYAKRINHVSVLFGTIKPEVLSDLKQKYLMPNQLDVRVARIARVLDHPNADKLYLIKLSLGDEERQVVAGLKPYYDKRELEGKKILLLYNLKPATLRGQESQGMILAVDGQDDVSVLEADAPEGTRLSTENDDIKQEISYDDFLSHELLFDKQLTINGMVLEGAVIKADKNLKGKVR